MFFVALSGGQAAFIEQSSARRNSHAGAITTVCKTWLGYSMSFLML